MKKEIRINEDWRINKLEIQENTCTNCQKEFFTVVNASMNDGKKKSGNEDNYNI